MAFCKDFNARTQTIEADTPMRVYINAFADKTFNFAVKNPQTSYLIKKCAGVERASKTPGPGREEVGVITLKHVYHIAQMKQEDNTNNTGSSRDNTISLQGICASVVSQCKSMGIAVVKDEEEAAKKFPQSL